MPTLRDGLKVDGERLSAEALDALAALSPDEADESVADLLDLIRYRALVITEAGFECQLTLSELSEFEIIAVGLARKRRRENDRDILAALIAQALGARDAHTLLPEDDPEVARVKRDYDFARRSWDVLDGSRAATPMAQSNIEGEPCPAS